MNAPAPAQAERKLRCRVKDRKHNPCANEALDDFGACLYCLREFTDHWETVKAEAVARLALLHQHPSATPVRDLCTRCGRTGHDQRSCDT